MRTQTCLTTFRRHFPFETWAILHTAVHTRTEVQRVARPISVRQMTPSDVEKEEEAVFISVVNTNEDPPNAHQAQHRPVQATGAMSA